MASPAMSVPLSDVDAGAVAVVAAEDDVLVDVSDDPQPAAATASAIIATSSPST